MSAVTAVAAIVLTFTGIVVYLLVVLAVFRLMKRRELSKWRSRRAKNAYEHYHGVVDLGGYELEPTEYDDTGERLQPAMPIAEVFPAGAFVCDRCGEHNYFALFGLEKEVITEAEMRQLLPRTTVSREGNFYLYPIDVTCHACQRNYLVVQAEQALE
jgi:hypothetical protein